jgi:hypothetical protein
MLLSRDLDRTDLGGSAIPDVHLVLAVPRRFSTRERETNPAVFVELGFRSKDLALVRAKVGWAVAIELDVGAEVYQLDLVQPASMNLDVQSQKNVQRRVGFDLDRGPGAVYDRPSPRMSGLSLAENHDEND